MKVTVKIEEIHYGDVAVRALPLLARAAENRNDAVGKAIAAVAQLPEHLVYDIADTFSPEQKNEILAAFVMEHKEKFLGILNDLSEKHKIGAALSDCSVSENLEFSAVIQKMDYFTLAERFLPQIREKLLGMGGMVTFLRPVIARASAEQVCGLLDKLPEETRDSLVASLVQKNQDRLIAGIEKAAAKQNIRVKLHSVTVEA